MCNLYNSGGYGCCGFGTNGTTNTTNTTNTTGTRFVCGYWNGGYQRMCRDSCGNVLTRNTGAQRQTCCCPCYHTCGCGCGNGCNGGGNGGTTTGNNGTGATGGNGFFRCVTFCGYGNGLLQTNGTSTTNDAAAYYARQYGLTCDDNADCVYNF